MWYYDEGTGMVLLIIVLVAVVGYLLYQLAVSASYILVALLGVIYTTLAFAGSLLLAGLDMLLVPAQLDALPWAAWAAWGGICGAAAGFWSVAPVYGLRRLRPAILLTPLVAVVAVFALRLVFAPPPLAAVPATGASPAGTAPAAQAWVSFITPVWFTGIKRSHEEQQPTQITIGIGDQAEVCADLPAGPPLAPAQPQQPVWPQPEPPEQQSAATFLLRPFCTSDYTGQIPLLASIQPSTLGYAGDTAYWTPSSERGGYLVWFLSPDGVRLMFTLVVEPSGEYHFVDGALWGAGALQGGAREYVFSTRSGVLGLSRRRQRVRVEWLPRGFRRDDGKVVEQFGVGFGHCTFPEGELKLDITPLYAQTAPRT